MTRTLPFAALAATVVIANGCGHAIERGPRLDEIGSEPIASTWECALRDAPEIRRARARTLAFFRGPIRRRLESIPIYISRCDDPELAGAYCPGGLSGWLHCGATTEEIDLFHSPSEELARWENAIDTEANEARSGASFFTANLWFGGVLHRQVRFPLSARSRALEAIREGIRNTLVSILLHEYFHALAADGLIDPTAISLAVDNLDPDRYPIVELVRQGREAYPWWLFLQRNEESACLTAEYHLVFGYDLPDSLAKQFTSVADTRRKIAGPLMMQIPEWPALSARPRTER